jgi:hypothetical protein
MMGILLGPYKWFIAAGGIIALIAALWGALAVHDRNIRLDERTKVVGEYNQKIAEQKAAAQVSLDAETAKASAASTALKEIKDVQENTDVINAKTIELLAGKLNALRLRSGTQAGLGGGSGGGTQGSITAAASAGSADPAPSTGVLSDATVEFLLSQSKQADTINIAYISCRADALAVRAEYARVIGP